MNTKKILSLAIAGAIFAPIATFAQETSTIATTTSATSTQITCMQNSLEKRENALISAHDTYGVAVKTALTNRLAGLKSSWTMIEKKDRVAKREATYKAFRTEMQAANTALRNVKNTAWKTFQADSKACGVKGTGENPSIISTANISL